MPSKYASGKYAIAECDRCGQRYMLKDLQKQVLKTKLYNKRLAGFRRLFELGTQAIFGNDEGCSAL